VQGTDSEQNGKIDCCIAFVRPIAIRAIYWIFIMASQLLPNTAAVFGLIPCALGINAILRPRTALDIFQFPLPTSPEAQKLTDNLLRIYGARDISMGLATLIAWYFDDRKVLGWLMISGCVVTTVDGWVSRMQIGKAEWYV